MKRLSLLPASALILTLLAACESSEFAVPEVQIPRDCEDLARPVRKPAFKDDEDFRVIAGKYAQRLNQANSNLSATAKCQRDVRENSVK